MAPPEGNLPPIASSSSATQFVFAPPTPFDFKNPSSWERWVQRFERYKEVSCLSELPSERQVTTLMYCMGEDAEDILTASKLTVEEKKSYNLVKRMFTEFFIGKRNVIYERAKFNTRVQQEGESIESFATDLRKLGEHCNYDKLLDEFIRDRIVIGIRDQQLSESMQLDAELTLEKALTKCRQKEAVRRQQTDLQNIGITPKSSGVDRVFQRRPNNSKRSDRCDVNSSTNCWNCGLSKHSRDQCPAKDATCHKCQKVGHYAKLCKQKGAAKLKDNKSHPKKVNEVQDTSASDGYAFLGSINAVDINSVSQTVKKVGDKYYATLRVNDKSIEFKLDCGADVTVIPPDKVQPHQQLRPSDRVLIGSGGHSLDVVGMFDATLQSRSKQVVDKVYVVRNQQEPLLGTPALEKFNIIQINRIDQVTSIREMVYQKYPELFRTHGTLKGKYKIELEPGAVPYSITVARNIPIPLQKRVETELNRVESLDIIAKVVEPTEWCAPIVVVPKADGSVRVCVDLSQLNQFVKRSRIILPDVEHTLGIIGSSRIFTKLDAMSGYWQIQLDEESAKLTTFITPFGRYFFKRLPFGISSAPEYFQLRMQELLKGLDGVVCHMDDILIHGKTQQEHDNRLVAVLNRLKSEGLVLNKNKCVFSANKVKFLGQIIDHESVRPDPDRVKALVDFPAPKDVSEVRRFNGLVNQLSKFIPNLASKMQPIRELLRKDVRFLWGPDQQAALTSITLEIQREISLLRYDVNADIVLSADASTYGLGAVLFQGSANKEIKPVSFASRTLSDTERRYAQIEKEALALTWACEKFDTFLRGRTFKIETDHKPLVPLLSTKSLVDIPPRIQRFKMRLMKYCFTIHHTPGKQLYTADCLSRAPIKIDDECELSREVEAYIHHITLKSFPASQSRLNQLVREQQQDDECRELYRFIQQGWPEAISKVPLLIRQWFPHRGELTIVGGLICRGSRIIIPRQSRPEILNRLHDGHLGVSRCLDRARTSVFWPGITAEINRFVERCEICSKHRSSSTYPMIPTLTPSGPWVRVAIDYFELNRYRFIVIIDYYSRYIELARVTSLTVSELILKCKAIFARHGIPLEVFSDSGSQFTSAEWKQFANNYGFKIITSSPHYHQSNGEAERAVQTIKQLLMKNPEDPFIALLSYRATPNVSGLSPAELLMGRRLRTRLPSLPENLQPKPIDHDEFISKDTENRQKQAEHYNQRHRVTPEKPLEMGSRVYIPDRQAEGVITDNTDAPRSVIVETADGTVRRNSTMLRPLVSPVSPQTTVSSPIEVTSAQDSKSSSPVRVLEKNVPMSRYGRVLKDPDRYTP